MVVPQKHEISQPFFAPIVDTDISSFQETGNSLNIANNFGLDENRISGLQFINVLRNIFACVWSCLCMIDKYFSGLYFFRLH